MMTRRRTSRTDLVLRLIVAGCAAVQVAYIIICLTYLANPSHLP